MTHDGYPGFLTAELRWAVLALRLCVLAQENQKYEIRNKSKIRNHNVSNSCDRRQLRSVVLALHMRRLNFET